MKKEILLGSMILFLLFAPLTKAAFAGGEMKEVCTPKVDKAGKAVMDKKSGKQAEDCKKIKVHKKVEGDKVPEPAKKK
jgi:hypothetical protein